MITEHIDTTKEVRFSRNHNFYSIESTQLTTNSNISIEWNRGYFAPKTLVIQSKFSIYAASKEPLEIKIGVESKTCRARGITVIDVSNVDNFSFDYPDTIDYSFQIFLTTKDQKPGFVKSKNDVYFDTLNPDFYNLSRMKLARHKIYSNVNAATDLMFGKIYPCDFSGKAFPGGSVFYSRIACKTLYYKKSDGTYLDTKIIKSVYIYPAYGVYTDWPSYREMWKRMSIVVPQPNGKLTGSIVDNVGTLIRSAPSAYLQPDRFVNVFPARNFDSRVFPDFTQTFVVDNPYPYLDYLTPGFDDVKYLILSGGPPFFYSYHSPIFELDVMAIYGLDFDTPY